MLYLAAIILISNLYINPMHVDTIIVVATLDIDYSGVNAEEREYGKVLSRCVILKNTPTDNLIITQCRQLWHARDKTTEALQANGIQINPTNVHTRQVVMVATCPEIRGQPTYILQQRIKCHRGFERVVQTSRCAVTARLSCGTVLDIQTSGNIVTVAPTVLHARRSTCAVRRLLSAEYTSGADV
jgi:hypothetical protein